MNRAWMTLNSHLVKAVQVQLKLKLSSTWTQLMASLRVAPEPSRQESSWAPASPVH